MAKRNKRNKMTAEEIEAQRMEAHGTPLEMHPSDVPLEDGIMKLIPSTQPKMEPEPTKEDEAAYEEQQREEFEQEDKEAGFEPTGDAAHDYKSERNKEMSDPGAADEYGTPDEDDEEEDKPITSVVAEKFKLKYIEQAKAAGIAGKAAKRSSWDWLAQQIAEQCLGEKEKLNVNDFMDLLECNGVDYSRWTNRNRGWEGRFRMTGRVALQKVVANAGVLKTMSGEIVPPPEWVEKYKDKG